MPLGRGSSIKSRNSPGNQDWAGHSGAMRWLLNLLDHSVYERPRVENVRKYPRPVRGKRVHWGSGTRLKNTESLLLKHMVNKSRWGVFNTNVNIVAKWNISRRNYSVATTLPRRDKLSANILSLPGRQPCSELSRPSWIKVKSCASIQST